MVLNRIYDVDNEGSAGKVFATSCRNPRGQRESDAESLLRKFHRNPNNDRCDEI